MSPVLFAVILLAGVGKSANAASLPDLVKQLGDAKFARREAAQKELLRRGEGIVPELDRLAKTADAETADRIGKVRYELVGYKDDMRRLLADWQERMDGSPLVLSNELRSLIATHHPRSGDLLLSILGQPDHRLFRGALRAFVATWDQATAAQVDQYIQQMMILKTNPRAKYPGKVGAVIPVEAQLRDGVDGASGWPSNYGGKSFDFRMRTTRFLNGKQYDKSFDCTYPCHWVGVYKVGELQKGDYTIDAVMEYEFTHRGEKRTGQIRSKASRFTVVSPDTPDDLLAPKSESLTKQVEGSIRFREPKSQNEIAASWETSPGKRAGLTGIYLDIGPVTDVDLCFDVEVHEVKTGKVYTAHPFAAFRGSAQSGTTIAPRDAPAFAADWDGEVTVRVVLKPSRALALTFPQVTKYYPEPITSGQLRIKVFRTLPSTPEHK